MPRKINQRNQGFKPLTVADGVVSVILTGDKRIIAGMRQWFDSTASGATLRLWDVDVNGFQKVVRTWPRSRVIWLLTSRD